MGTETLLEIIKKHRKELRITTTDMSHHLGYKYPSGYVKIENGTKKQLTFIQIVRIFQLLHIGFENVDLNKFTLQKLKTYRIKKGLTIKDMASRLGYKYPSGYANLEYGKRKLSFEKAVEISKILNVSLEELFFDS